MSEYSKLIDRITTGEHITPEQLATARSVDDATAARAAEDREIADDATAARSTFEKGKVAHESKHQPIIAGLIAELESAHAAVVEAYPAFQAAQEAYNKVQATRHDRYRALFAYVGEHYGHKHSILDYATGLPEYDTHLSGMGAVVVEGHIINPDGTRQHDGVTDL